MNMACYRKMYMLCQQLDIYSSTRNIYYLLISQFRNFVVVFSAFALISCTFINSVTYYVIQIDITHFSFLSYFSHILTFASKNRKWTSLCLNLASIFLLLWLRLWRKKKKNHKLHCSFWRKLSIFYFLHLHAIHDLNKSEIVVINPIGIIEKLEIYLCWCLWRLLSCIYW